MAAPEEEIPVERPYKSLFDYLPSLQKGDPMKGLYQTETIPQTRAYVPAVPKPLPGRTPEAEAALHPSVAAKHQTDASPVSDGKNPNRPNEGAPDHEPMPARRPGLKPVEGNFERYQFTDDPWESANMKARRAGDQSVAADTLSMRMGNAKAKAEMDADAQAEKARIQRDADENDPMRKKIEAAQKDQAYEDLMVSEEPPPLIRSDATSKNGQEGVTSYQTPRAGETPLRQGEAMRAASNPANRKAAQRAPILQRLRVLDAEVSRAEASGDKAYIARAQADFARAERLAQMEFSGIAERNTGRWEPDEGPPPVAR